jgi:hypothetical protein
LLTLSAWADISKKATYRIKRQFQKMDKEAQKEAQLKKARGRLSKQHDALFGTSHVGGRKHSRRSLGCHSTRTGQCEQKETKASRATTTTR